ncbi:hypothetical protein BJV77DRAFT_1029582 [Russula vinacea]|nr:hypothetical protein BJV77DRAFT_1029582 [Russula vinacea]
MRIVPSIATATASLAFVPRAVLGSLYVISPVAGTVCHGGQPCLAQWLDDGQAPLLTAMGPCHVALYAGNEELIQQIEPVDVSTADSLTFTPSPKAGPNSNTYYLQFTSVNSSDPSFMAFSSSFSLDRMSGSFQSPVSELTSSIPVPSSVLTAHPNSISTSLLPETISLSMPPTLSSSSLLLSSSPASTSPSATNTPSHSNAAVRHPLQLSVVISLSLSILFLV